ncbi:E3 ubiquitin-protein ligase TRIM33-like isoform X2 [Corticium candelabrum]|uniref:E3 ubiquitin-protein ligase TRIM33-like isoform X2 n=1 Tax=Corticium candelabrum TaxID=121492 RepID=UPI002E260987|nr:E3 ubiquitin-protein ligase TRIM33-like isoform X2 [Corticium candelabrum]
MALDHFRAAMQCSLRRLEDAEQQLDSASTKLTSNIQTVGIEAEKMQRASKQMFDELVGMLMRGRKELMQSVTEQRQRRVTELTGKHSSVIQKLNQVREAKRQCQQLLQRRLDLDLLLRKERIEAALTRAADLPEGDWSARPSRIPRISGEALMRDLMALMRKHTEIVVFRAGQSENNTNTSTQSKDSSDGNRASHLTSQSKSPNGSQVALSHSPGTESQLLPRTDSSTQTESETSNPVESEQAPSENEDTQNGDDAVAATSTESMETSEVVETMESEASGRKPSEVTESSEAIETSESVEMMNRVRTRSSSVKADSSKSERQWPSCEFEKQVAEPAPATEDSATVTEPADKPSWSYSPLGSPNGSSGPPSASVSASAPASSTSDHMFEDGLGPDGSYDYCARCSNGGDLICCDSCPLAYHSQCLDVESSPSDSWNCPVCEANFQPPPTRKIPDEVKPAQACPLLLDLVLWHDGSYPFRKPVTRKEAPDYYDVVQRPMDLSLIERNMANGDYTEDRPRFINDMQLIFDNCMLYNKPWTEVFALGVKMRTFFEQKLKMYASWLMVLSNETEPAPKRTRLQ